MSEAASTDVFSDSSVAPIESDAGENFSEEIENEENVEGNEENEDGEGQEELSEKEIKKEIKRIKQLKLKYNGKEYLEDLPFEIDDNPEQIEYLTKQLQMAKMGNSKAQQYATLEGEIRQFVEDLKADPRKILSNPNLGVDLKQLAAEILEEEIENSKKSPEQLEKEALQKKLADLEAEREKENEDRKAKEFERLQNQEFERYDMLMNDALEKSTLPKSPYVVKKMADYLILGIQNNLDVQPADIIPLIEQEIRSDLTQMFEVLPAEVINELLGKDAYNKVRKYNVSKARKKKASPATKKKVTDVGKVKEEQKSNEESQKMTYKDFFGA